MSTGQTDRSTGTENITRGVLSFIRKYCHHGVSLVAQWLRACMPVRGRGFSPWSGKTLHAMGQLSLCATTAKACVPRVCALQREKPPQLERSLGAHS